MKTKITTSHLVLIILFLMSFYACQDSQMKSPQKVAYNQSAFTDEEVKRIVLLDTSYLYPVETAKMIALDHASRLLDKEDGAIRTISNVATIQSLFSLTGSTRIKTDFRISKPKTPSLYVVNFKDQKGFIILSADKRATEILATVGSGTLDSATAHLGLRIYLENAIKHIDEAVGKLEGMRGDALFNSMVAKEQALINTQQKESSSNARTQVQCNGTLVVPNVTEGTGNSMSATQTDCGGTCNVYVTTTPIATLNVTNYISMPLIATKWDQGPPFNLAQPPGGCITTGCLGQTNSRYLAGCVAVAEGQVVAYFYAKRNVGDWAAVTNQIIGCNFTSIQSTEVATLLHNIYLSYGIYTSTTCKSVGAGFDIGDISITNPRGISPANGLVQGTWRSWNTGDIRSSLAMGSPVVITGSLHLCSTLGICPCWGCGGGHEWIIDGMRDLGVQTTYKTYIAQTGTGCPSTLTSYTFNTTVVNSTQIHQNWGWGQGSGGEANDCYDQESFRSNIPSTDDINFNHANYIVAFINPN